MSTYLSPEVQSILGSDTSSFSTWKNSQGGNTVTNTVYSIPSAQTSQGGSVFSTLNAGLGFVNDLASSIANIRSAIKPQTAVVQQQASAQPVVGTQAPAQGQNTVIIPSSGTSDWLPSGGASFNYMPYLLIGGALLAVALLMRK